MKYRNRMLRAAVRLVERNRPKLDERGIVGIVGDLDFLAVFDAIMEEVDAERLVMHVEHSVVAVGSRMVFDRKIHPIDKDCYTRTDMVAPHIFG